MVLATSLISAALASGGTYLALSASGALNRQAQVAASPAVASAVETAAATSAPLDRGSPIITVAARVSPAVVTIDSVAGLDANDPLSIPQEGVGSGIIFDSNGWILTNRHVIAGSDTITVKLNDGREFPGTVYGIDTLTDLAIVRISGQGLPAADIGDSSRLQVGETVVAIGSPLGTYTDTVTSGIISATGRSIVVDSGRINNLIQTDAAINPGNSGGPLLNLAGAVIGINTAIARDAPGIGFAIPINIARPMMQQALAGQKLARPWIGIRYVAIDIKVQQQEKLPVDHGAYVAAGSGSTQPAVVPNSPAEKAGVREHDIIISIEDVTIDLQHPLDDVLTQFAPGRTVTLRVLRDGVPTTLELTLGTRPATL
jgi:S1-C subfamily serine protease